MPNKIKDKTDIPEKIHKVPPIEKICFCFSHITNNKSFSFHNVSVGNKAEAYESLIEKFSELSCISIDEAHRRGKKLGAERIPYAQLDHRFQSVCDDSHIISKDSKLIVFQFCCHKYRLICKDDIIHSNLLHVIGFDFDYSAYNHG